MGDAVENLIALAGRIRVEGHSRRSKSGKTTQVSAHTRSPSKMTLGEIEEELKALGDSAQDKNRAAQLRNEARSRRIESSVEPGRKRRLGVQRNLQGQKKAKEEGTWSEGVGHDVEPSGADKTKSIVQQRKEVFQAALEGRATLVPAGARDNKTAEVYIDGKKVGQASTLMHSVREDPDDPKSKTTFGERKLVPAYSWKLSGEEEKAALEFERSRAPKPIPGASKAQGFNKPASKADDSGMTYKLSDFELQQKIDELRNADPKDAAERKAMQSRLNDFIAVREARGKARGWDPDDKNPPRPLKDGPSTADVLTGKSSGSKNSKGETFEESVRAVLKGKGGTMGAVAEGLSEMGLGKNPKKKGSLANADDAKPGETFREYMARDHEKSKAEEAKQTEKALAKVRAKREAAAIAADGPFPNHTTEFMKKWIKEHKERVSKGYDVGSSARIRAKEFAAEIERRKNAAKKKKG